VLNYKKIRRMVFNEAKQKVRGSLPVSITVARSAALFGEMQCKQVTGKFSLFRINPLDRYCKIKDHNKGHNLLSLVRCP